MSISPDEAFNIEVLKLLLNIAKADGTLDQRELLMVKGLGRRRNVSEGELQKLLTAAEQGAPLPTPDFAVLKARPDDVLQTALAMITVDGRIHPNEKAILAKIREAVKG